MLLCIGKRTKKETETFYDLHHLGYVLVTMAAAHAARRVKRIVFAVKYGGVTKKTANRGWEHSQFVSVLYCVIIY
jgi:hypothetical protein